MLDHPGKILFGGVFGALLGPEIEESARSSKKKIQINGSQKIYENVRPKLVGCSCFIPDPANSQSFSEKNLDIFNAP